MPNFSERMMPHLHSLAGTMLNNRHYHWLSIVTQVMAGLHGGGWERLDNDTKLYWLERMSSDFHPKGMGDSEYAVDPSYSMILELIGYETRALSRSK
jgi:hypothetical protein